MGSGYHGLQINDHDERINTIEGDLKQALIGANAIKESNQSDLSKIKWSRSSRTDKGVHAARVVISCKLEVRAEWGGQESFPELVGELNESLPPSIRIFSIKRVSRSFQARGNSLWRQ